MSVEQASDAEESNSGHYISFLAVFERVFVIGNHRSIKIRRAFMCMCVCLMSFVKSDPNTNGVLFNVVRIP